ncbi:integral membrane protein [Fusarium pseudocircinatum]|uniref:Integral membrane protein n=1 Tax=Fusarium pseudocircinatum TaxID=56676 RepID=A0A8H5P876_9HYPO|nr:integral membrane protein [Fusarium pseudocircinatum]
METTKIRELLSSERIIKCMALAYANESDTNPKGSYEFVVIDAVQYRLLIRDDAVVESPRSGGPIHDKLALEACSELTSVAYEVLAWRPYCDEAMPFMDQKGNTLAIAERPSIENWPDLGVTRLREQNLQLQRTAIWRETGKVQDQLWESYSTDMCLAAFSVDDRKQELLRQDVKENVEELSSLHKEVKDLEAANNNGNKDPRMAELLEGPLTVQERKDALASASSHEKEVQKRYNDEYATNGQSRRFVEITSELKTARDEKENAELVRWDAEFRMQVAKQNLLHLLIFMGVNGLNVDTSLPDCAQICFRTSVSPDCSEPSCFCASATFQDDLIACLKSQCKIPQVFASLRHLDQTCERSRRDRRNDAWPYLSIHILCILCAVIRVYTKLFIVRKISPEDWLSFTSLVIYIVYFGIGHHALMSAFGQDIWWVNADDLSHALKLFWIDCPVYTLLLGMTKVTIILFYIRLCHVYTLFCQLCWACILIISISTGVFMSLNIFQCTPIRWNWDRFGGEDVDFWCMDLNKLQWSINITNIIFDIVVLVLPIPLIWKSMSSHNSRRYKLTLKAKSTFRRKLGIVLMFSLGVVVLVASCLKMRYNVLYGHSNNITWDYMDLMVWAGIESSVSIAAPCLPTVRLFLHKVFPTSFGRIFAFGSHVERTLDQEIKEEEEEVAQWAADVEMTGISGVARPRRAAISLGEGFGDGRRTKKKRALTEASRILRSVDEIPLSP